MVKYKVLFQARRTWGRMHEIVPKTIKNYFLLAWCYNIVVKRKRQYTTLEWYILQKNDYVSQLIVQNTDIEATESTFLRTWLLV
jgi:hypothetical protein